MGCAAIVVILLIIGIVGTTFDVFSTALVDAYHHPRFFLPTIACFVAFSLYRGFAAASKRRLWVSSILFLVVLFSLFKNEHTLANRFVEVNFKSETPNIIIYFSDAKHLETEELRGTQRVVLVKPGKYEYSAGGDGKYELTKEGALEIAKGETEARTIELGSVPLKPTKRDLSCGRKLIGCTGHWVENTWVPYQ